MKLGFDGKVVLVTGGNSGIGRSIAIMLAREGASVVIAARGVEKGEETAELIRHEGGECFFSRTDVSMRQDVERLATEIAHTYGGLDCPVNNAGIEGEKESDERCVRKKRVQ